MEEEELSRISNLVESAIINLVKDRDTESITTIPASYFEEQKLPLILVTIQAHQMGFATRYERGDGKREMAEGVGQISFLYVGPRGQNEMYRITGDDEQDIAYNHEVERIRRKLPSGFRLA